MHTSEVCTVHIPLRSSVPSPGTTIHDKQLPVPSHLYRINKYNAYLEKEQERPKTQSKTQERMNLLCFFFDMSGFFRIVS